MGAFVKGKKTREKTTGAKARPGSICSPVRGGKPSIMEGAYHQAAAGLPDREKTTGLAGGFLLRPANPGLCPEACREAPGLPGEAADEEFRAPAPGTHGRMSRGRSRGRLSSPPPSSACAGRQSAAAAATMRISVSGRADRTSSSRAEVTGRKCTPMGASGRRSRRAAFPPRPGGRPPGRWPGC